MKFNENKQKNDWPLLGNEHIRDFLIKCIKNDKVAHAYIFLGPEDLGKTTAANYLAKSLLCHNRENISEDIACGSCQSCRKFSKKLSDGENGLGFDALSSHGEFHVVRKDPEKRNITVEQIREFIKSLALSSFFDSYKVGIIKDAHVLSMEASNALLKNLEEPRKKTVIILVAKTLESLPETILSRCQIINFHPVDKNIIYDYLLNQYGASRSEAKKISRLSLGRPALAVKFLEDKDFYNNYLNIVKTYFDIIKSDIIVRLDLIHGLIGQGSGRESVDLVSKIITIWQGLSRDVLLILNDHGDLIQHEIVNQELLEVAKRRVEPQRFVGNIHDLNLGMKYLFGNVNPKLVLENIAINI